MYAHVSREEWIWRGLAIATILALVGIAVMPAMAVGELSYGLSAASACWSASQGDIVGIAFGIAGMHLAIIGAAISPPASAAALAVFL